ncbi:phage major capsid protein [Streptomyces sp. SW4]|nr:phage major capsid protein [Streptomyces sp. SW4]
MLRDNGFDADTKGAAGAIKRLDLDPQAKRKPNMLISHRQGTAHNPGAPGAVVDQLFADGIDYVRNIWHKNTKADAAKLAELRNAASSVSPADGGFLVPEVLRSQLLEIALEMAVVRPLATVVPMDSARVPFPMIDSSTNAGSVFGGMITYWGEEGAALTDSNPSSGGSSWTRRSSRASAWSRTSCSRTRSSASWACWSGCGRRPSRSKRTPSS